MSGHSKWSTIKRQKSTKDAARGQIFTKIGNAITVAVRDGGGTDPDANFRLRLAIDKARQVNMPKDNIQRAIDRAKGKAGDGQNLAEILYEGFGPSGIAVIIETVTDNKQRTAAEIKSYFTNHGGNLAGIGSAAYNFKRVGEIRLVQKETADAMLEMALESGADDVEEEDDDGFIIYTQPQELHRVKDFLIRKNLTVQECELTYKPVNLVTVQDKNSADKIISFLSGLDNLPDVHKVHANVDIPKTLLT